MQLRVFLVLFLIGRGISFAESNSCIDGSSTNMLFKKTLQTSNASMIRDFRASPAYKGSEGRLGCALGNCDSVTKPLNLKQQVTEIPKGCIRASLKRKVAQTSIECRKQFDGNWQFVKHSKLSKSTPCFDDTTVDYVHHVTNKVLSCFQGLSLKNGVQESVDPKILYSKLNNESGFNFTYSYEGGAGAGQLTSWAVQEMNVLESSRTGGRVVPGSGRFILDSILKSNQSECQGLQPIIKNDLKFKYSSPRKLNCEWVSLESGLARNLIYSLGYFSFLKHELIGKELKRRAPSAYNDSELLNLLTLVAYGPGGTNRALTLIRTLGMSAAGSSLASIKQRVKNETYVKSTNSKMIEVKKIAGDSCRLL